MNKSVKLSSKILALAFALVLTAVFSLATAIPAYAAAVVTPASGGDAIPSSTAGGTYTSLGMITVAEGEKGDISRSQTDRTFNLQAPDGFEFNAGQTPSISYESGRDITAISIGITATTITVTLSTDDNSNKYDIIYIGETTAVQVRPTATSPLASGQIYRPTTNYGTLTFTGLTGTSNTDGSGGVNFGTLVEIDDAPTADATQSTLTPTTATIAADGTSTQVLTVTAKDSSGDAITTGGATVVISRLSGTGTIGSVTDNGDGTYTATVTAPSSAGSGIFAATLDGNPVQSGTGSQTQATITYAATTHTITASAGTNGSIAPSGAVSVSDGDNQTFTITPSTGYHVNDVLADSVSQGAITSYTFTNVTGDHTISATFAINTYTLTYTAGLNGSITGTSPQTVDYGASGTQVTAVPNTGYHFVQWSDGVLTASRTDTGVTADINVTATFAIDTFTITTGAGTGGSITPSGAVTADYGDNVTFTVTIDTGHALVDLLVDSISQGAITTYTFNNVAADHTIQAVFDTTVYTITASAGTGGSISPSGSVSVDAGDNRTFTITPNSGHEIYDVLVDGVSQGAIASYTFNNVSSGHTIAASFSTISHTITATKDFGGSITPAGATSVIAGDNQTYTITADTGYNILNVLVDGVSQGNISSYTFTNVTGDHTIYVTYCATSADYFGTFQEIPGGSTGVEYAPSSFGVTVVISTTGTVEVKVLRYTSNPHPEASLPTNAVNIFKDVILSDLNNVSWPLHVEISYTDADVAALEESTLKMYYFQGDSWHQCSNTGVNAAENYVWAELTEAEAGGSPLTFSGSPLGGATVVGGDVFRIDKAQVMLPWLAGAIAMIMAAVFSAVYIFKKRRASN